MDKNEICWAIFSGEVMLPFTIRHTKTQCIYDRNRSYGENSLRPPKNGRLIKIETCRKVVINEFKQQETR